MLHIAYLLPLFLLLTSVIPVPCNATQTTEAAQLDQEVTHLRSNIAKNPSNAFLHLQLATTLHKLNHLKPDGGRRIPEAEKAYRYTTQCSTVVMGDTAASPCQHVGSLQSCERSAYKLQAAEAATTIQCMQRILACTNWSCERPTSRMLCRAALDAISQQNAALYINVQGNLGALLLSGNEPEAAILELQQALQLAEQQQQPLQQHAGLLFNLGKALTTVGKLPEAETTYATATSAAHGHDFASYSKALAAKRSIEPAAAEQAVEVAEAARQHCGSQQQLAFLRDYRPSGVGGQVQVEKQEWIEQADSVDMVWLHFALFNYYHHSK